MGDDSFAWFGVISSTASAVGSVIKSKKMLRVGSAHQETFGGYIDGDGGTKPMAYIDVDEKDIN